MKETLTQHEQEMIPVIRDRWLNYILSCNNNLDKEKAAKGIEWLYKFCKKEKPIMIFMDSPLGCQIAANFFINKGQNIWQNIWQNIGQNIGQNIRQNIRQNIEQNILQNIRQNIWQNIRQNIWQNIVNGDLKYHSTSYYGGITDYGWVSYVDYFFQLGLIKAKEESDFNSFKEFLLSGIYDMIQFDGMCICSGMPVVIKQDSETRLHNVNGYAVKWRDEFGMNFIHGVFINDDLYEKLTSKLLTFEEWAKEGNEEVKSAILSFMEEKWGSEYLFRFISDNLKEVDTYTDKKDKKYLVGTTGGMNIGVYTLFKGRLNNVEGKLKSNGRDKENFVDLAFVRCYCPSTDRMFFLCVGAENKTAKDAIASLYRIPAKLKKEIKYINRQGERFSTVLTEKGDKILDAMNQEEINDLVHISGDEYFSKMRYEY